MIILVGNNPSGLGLKDDRLLDGARYFFSKYCGGQPPGRFPDDTNGLIRQPGMEKEEIPAMNKVRK